MHSGEMRDRLRDLADAIGVDAFTSATGAEPGRELELGMAAMIDALLRRVAATTAWMGAGSTWSEQERVAARVMLADLSLIAAGLRSLNTLSRSRLRSAQDEMLEAQRQLDDLLGGSDRPGGDTGH